MQSYIFQRVCRHFDCFLPPELPPTCRLIQAEKHRCRVSTEGICTISAPSLHIGSPIEKTLKRNCDFCRLAAWVFLESIVYQRVWRDFGYFLPPNLPPMCRLLQAEQHRCRTSPNGRNLHICLPVMVDSTENISSSWGRLDGFSSSWREAKGKKRKPTKLVTLHRLLAESKGFEPSKPLWRLTRFPVVLLRPTRTTLRLLNGDYYTIWRSKNQVFF